MTCTDRLVSSILSYSSVRPTAAMLRRLACEHKAKKDYIALRKGQGTSITVQDSCLTLMKDSCCLGASSDGFVTEESGSGVLEIECPAQLEGIDITHMTPLDVGQNAKFYCSTSEKALYLKKSSNHYCQVQGEMGVTGAKW